MLSRDSGASLKSVDEASWNLKREVPLKRQGDRVAVKHERKRCICFSGGLAVRIIW